MNSNLIDKLIYHEMLFSRALCLLRARRARERAIHCWQMINDIYWLLNVFLKGEEKNKVSFNMQIFWLKVVNFSHTIIHSIYEENAELCVSSLEVWAPVDQIRRVVTWRYLKFVCCLLDSLHNLIVSKWLFFEINFQSISKVFNLHHQPNSITSD